MSEPVDPTVFYECLEMDMATAYIQHAGASEAATHVVHDLVKSGVYHMPTGTPEGGYTILRITPIITSGDDLTVEPIEFGANVIAPDMADWSREATEQIAAGNKKLSRLSIGATEIGKLLSDKAFDTLARLTGGLELDDIRDAVMDIPSRMLGGIVTAGLFHPPIDEGVVGYAIPYWHRALPSTVNTEAVLEHAPRLMRDRMRKLVGNEDTIGGLALVKLFSRTVQKETVAIDDNVNLSLPPKRFVS